MGKYTNKNNIFKEEPEISVSEHVVQKNGRRLKMVIPEGKIGYGDKESHAQIAGDLATKHSDDTKAGEKAYAVGEGIGAATAGSICNATSFPAASGALCIGRFMSRADADGYAKVYVNLPHNA